MAGYINAMHAARGINTASVKNRQDLRAARTKQAMYSDDNKAKHFATEWIRSEDEAGYYAGEAHDITEVLNTTAGEQLSSGIQQYAQSRFYTQASKSTAFNVLSAGLVVAFADKEVLIDLAKDLATRYSHDDLNRMQRQHKYDSHAQVHAHLVTEFANAYAFQARLAAELLTNRAMSLAAQTSADNFEAIVAEAEVDTHDQFATNQGKYSLRGPSFYENIAYHDTNANDGIIFGAADGEDTYAYESADDAEDIDADAVV